MSYQSGVDSLPCYRGAPAIEADPWDLAVLSDPIPLQTRIRETAPVVWLPAHNLWATGRHRHVASLMSDWQTFESGAGVGLMDKRHERSWRPPSLLLEADPPRHDAPRSVLSRLLSVSSLRRLREDWANQAEELVDRVLGPSRESVEIDAVPDLAEAFPLSVFPDAVGLPEGGEEHLLAYSDHAFNTFGPNNELLRRTGQTIARHAGWVTQHCERDHLVPDGLGDNVWQASDREEITSQQAPLLVRSLLTAGLDTTVHGIGAVLHGASTHPDAWARLRADPTLSTVAFDEAVRWQSPVQAFTRTAVQDVEIAGTVIDRGEKILLMLAAANRDPRRWHDPDRFDVSRDPSGHVGFGMGIHQCVGQHVARLEATLLLQALLRRVEKIVPLGPPTPHLNNTLRAWASMPLALHPAR